MIKELVLCFSLIFAHINAEAASPSWEERGKTSSCFYRLIPWGARQHAWNGVFEKCHCNEIYTKRWELIACEFQHWRRAKHMDVFIDLYKKSHTERERDELKLIFQHLISLPTWTEENKNKFIKHWRESELSDEPEIIPAEHCDELYNLIYSDIESLIQERKIIAAAAILQVWGYIIPQVNELYHKLEASYQRCLLGKIFCISEKEKAYELTFHHYMCAQYVDFLHDKTASPDMFISYLASYLCETDVASKYCLLSLQRQANEGLLSEGRRKLLQDIEKKHADFFDDSYNTLKLQLLNEIKREIEQAEQSFQWHHHLDRAATLIYKIGWTLEESELLAIKEHYIRVLRAHDLID